MSRPIIGLLFAASFGCLTHEANAQYNARSARSISTATRNFLYNRPSVSPYVNLASRGATYGLPNYYTAVRPHIQAEEDRMAQRRQTAQLQQQMSEVRNQFRQSQMQATTAMTTGKVGWSARGLPRFGSTLSYYPGMRFVGRRR